MPLRTKIAAAIAAVSAAAVFLLAMLVTVAGTAAALPLAAVLAAGSAVAGFLLAQNLTQRLTTLSRLARRAAQEPQYLRGIRIPAAGGQDEVADIARALEVVARASQAPTVPDVNAEQRFTADVAHELRTPLTGLVTAAELLPPGRPTELVRDRVQKLRTLVEDLLEVSRLDARVETADLRPVELGHLVRNITAATAPEAHLDVRNDVRVLTDSRRVERVLSNLLINARKHAAPPFEVIVDGTVVTVRDHGPGFPSDLLRYGPRRFRTANRARGSGHGLGLTIAMGQAGVIGAELQFANHADGGQVALDFTERRLV